MQPSVNFEGIHYYIKLVKALEEYIQEELQDSAFYLALSRLSPNEYIKAIILEFAETERAHADSFQKAYHRLTGLSFTPKALSPIELNDYQSALSLMISDEVKDFKKYGEQYNMAPTPYLQDLFYMVKTMESQHIMRLPFLIAESIDIDSHFDGRANLRLVK